MSENGSYRPQMTWQPAEAEFAFHPECEAFPETKPEIKQWILDNMGKEGFSTHAPIWLTAEEPPRIAAGRCRYKCAKKLGISFLTANLKAGTDVHEFAKMEQDYRKHLSDEVWRERRLKEVADLRSEEKSTREIAEQLGVTQSAVARDIKKLAESPDSVPNASELPATVVGKDKKRRKASKSTPILCENCKRKGVQMAKCAGCKEAAMAYVKAKNDAKKAERDAAKAAKKSEKEAKKAAKAAAKKPETPDPVDDYGTVLPKSCRDAYCDDWLPSATDFLEDAVTAFWAEKLADGFNKRKGRYPWFKAQDVLDGIAMAGNNMADVLKHLRDNRPAGVCPACDGAKCKDCKHSGLVPKAEYEKLTKLLNKK